MTEFKGKKITQLNETTELTDESLVLVGESNGGTLSQATAKTLKDYATADLATKASVKANTDALGGHTVKSDVPADAKFTDTVYDDSEIKRRLDTVRSVQDQTIKAEDSSTPCTYSAGDFFVYDGKLYKASADFSSVTLTADNISQYAEAQTQTAINALNQSLFNSPDVLASNIPVIKAYPDNSTQSFGTCYKLWYWKVYSTVYVFFDIDRTSTGTIIYTPIKGYRPYYTDGMATWLTVHGGAENGIKVTARLGQMSSREVYIIPPKNAHIVGNFNYPAFD